MTNAVLTEKEELTQIVLEVQNDLSQFELLYDKVIHRVFYWCYGIVGNETDAKDVSQEAMILLFQKLHLLKDPNAFTSFLYQLVRNCCLNFLRLYKKNDLDYLVDNNFDSEFEERIEENRPYNLPKEIYDIEETKKLIASFIDTLPKRQKEVITLFYLEEFKIDEIAQILDYNSGSVKSRLHAGRKNLEIQIEAYQNKYNVKLYSLSLMPLLGMILQEQSEELFKNVDIKFDKTAFIDTVPLTATNFIEALWVKISLICFTVTVGITGVFGVSYLLQNIKKNSPKLIQDSQSMISPLKDNPYIDDVTYLNFPKRDFVNVQIKLKEEINKSNIHILYDDEEISFTKDGKDVFLEARENGVYTIQIHNRITNFHINQINPYAPQLTGVVYYKERLILILDDEMSSIDYEKSYILYNNQKHAISRDLMIPGHFEHKIDIILYDNDNHHIIYTIDVDEFE